jgi:hypothetical protein
MATDSYEVVLVHFARRKLKTKNPIKFFRFHFPFFSLNFYQFLDLALYLAKGNSDQV